MAFVVSLSIAAAAQADPVRATADDGMSLFADGGAVTIYFAGSDAGYSSQLFLDSPDAQGSFFPNHSTSIGQSFALGSFTADSELIFRLHVLTTGDDFFTGAASRNPDSLLHARMTSWSPSARISTPGVLIAFEDLLGGGDNDFDDFRFVVSGVRVDRAAVTPEPASLVLLGTGLVGAMLKARRRRSAGLGA